MSNSPQTEKLYPRYRYIWHLLAIRAVVIGPIAIVRLVAESIEGASHRLIKVFDKLLPEAYDKGMVEWGKLTPREQKVYEQLARARGVVIDRMMFQTQKTNRNI